MEVEGDEATIDCNKSRVSSYVSVTRQSSQGKKRRSSSASDTHKSVEIPSHIHVYMEKKHCFLCDEECKELDPKDRWILFKRCETKPIKEGEHSFKDTLSDIYVINVKMSGAERLLSDLRMSDVTYPQMMVCIML